MTAYRLRAGLTVRALPEGDAVVAKPDGMDAVIVNATAHAILDLLVEAREQREIVELFQQSFPDQDPHAIASDVDGLLAHLVSVGFVERG